MGLDPTRQWVMVSDYGSADGGDASLKIFGYDGSLIKQLSGAGSCGMLGCSGGFSRPQGAAVDAQGLIYLPDALLAQVLLYDPVSWNQTGTLGDHGFLRVPTDVVFDDFGDLFIASNRTREVQVVRGVGQP
jgi:sugar lactone lactonase YvrE